MTKPEGHTALPWRIQPFVPDSKFFRVLDAESMAVVDCVPKERAALICRAVNSHADLVKALELVRHNWAGHAEQCAFAKPGNRREERFACDCDWPNIRTQIDAALARAKEQTP